MKRTLIVVDMQNDFIDGSLGTEEAQAIVENVKKKIALYQKNGDEIIFTRDTHTEDYLQTNEGKHLPVEHCIAGTKGWCIADGLEVSGAKYVDKPTFGWLQWDKFDLQEVELVGLCTDICVVSNALIIKAVYPEIDVTVDAGCCAGVTKETHRAALETMKMCQVNVIGE
ncbi:MAG: cysteine hydrolase [Clostridium sp.]|nr:cysteine hydrolase [Clostridium sp.]